MRLPPLAIVVLVAGFAIGPACFLGPGSRAAKPAPRPPTHGPRIERGGQRMLAVPPADPAAAARAALVERGWSVQ
ncbi:MAG: hypothetical protein H0W72_17720, partial [Planctomycetes bacterium]|nr:hypothetical protein [Planctomycetota bacterium]